MFLHIYCICPGSRSGFVSLHMDPDPTYRYIILKIRIRIIDKFWLINYPSILSVFLTGLFNCPGSRQSLWTSPPLTLAAWPPVLLLIHPASRRHRCRLPAAWAMISMLWSPGACPMVWAVPRGRCWADAHSSSCTRRRPRLGWWTSCKSPTVVIQVHADPSCAGNAILRENFLL